MTMLTTDTPNQETEPTLKLCAQCHTMKPIADFLRRSGKRAGAPRRRGTCRSCRTALPEERVDAAAAELPGEADMLELAPAGGTTAASAPKRQRKRRRRGGTGSAAAATTPAPALEALLPQAQAEAPAVGTDAAVGEAALEPAYFDATEAVVAPPKRKRRRRRAGSVAAMSASASLEPTPPQAPLPAAEEAPAAADIEQPVAATAEPADTTSAGDAVAPPKRKRRRRRRGKKAKLAAPMPIAFTAPVRSGPPIDATGLKATRQGFIRMHGKTDNGRRWFQEIDLELAQTLVRERAAVIVNRHTIRRLYSNKEFRRLILTRDNYTCRFCGQYGDTIDHLLPRAKGGHTTPDNCVCACNLCNQTKADRDLEEFIGGADT
ncbi:HNH endonuclease [Paenibacillus koleovorans]|uniref:HNH endonuclease n=1 Tax=Paenibacillus koleovorans TaxID=121608 RepID=UPI00403A879B